MIRVLVILALCWGVLDGYQIFQNDIPNGDRVPHPCKPNFMWEGVGHKNIAGSGDRNPFGKDFSMNGLVWDECICRRDSDGDGRTNGEELGDPDCVWKRGDIPARSEDLSHPGVCEPVDSPYCAASNDWDFCEYEELDCPALKEEGVEEITLTFDETAVPAKETSYYCMTFELDLDPDVEYHIIGTEPQIDNKNVMHHAIILGCADGLDDDTRMDKPQPCGMQAQVKCTVALGGWTVGYPGSCLPDEYGYRAGKGGVKTVLMQFHWNNPKKRTDYTDESGMRLYLTRKLRPADGGGLVVGAGALTIPPGLTSLDQHGYCTANCTKYMPRPIKLTSLSFHMHYLGIGAKLVHTRNGTEQNVFEETDYSYDSPKKYTFDEPIEFWPGDEMTLTCRFKSTSRSSTTYNGRGTSDEMCLAFLDYYPAVPKLRMCMSYWEQTFCLMPGVSNKYGFLGSKCDFDNSTIIINMYETLMEHCNVTCSARCEDTVDTMIMEQECLGGTVQPIFEIEVLATYYGKIGRELVEMLHRCDEDWDSELFYIRAGVIDTSQTGSNATEKPTARPTGVITTRDPVPNGCVFDLDDDYGVAGAGHAAPWTVLVAMTTLLTGTRL